jgi:hypothetical protein
MVQVDYGVAFDDLKVRDCAVYTGVRTAVLLEPVKKGIPL